MHNMLGVAHGKHSVVRLSVCESGCGFLASGRLTLTLPVCHFDQTFLGALIFSGGQYSRKRRLCAI